MRSIEALIAVILSCLTAVLLGSFIWTLTTGVSKTEQQFQKVQEVYEQRLQTLYQSDASWLDPDRYHGGGDDYCLSQCFDRSIDFCRSSESGSPECQCSVKCRVCSPNNGSGTKNEPGLLSMVVSERLGYETRAELG